jgi:hypothetical protein
MAKVGELMFGLCPRCGGPRALIRNYDEAGVVVEIRAVCGGDPSHDQSPAQRAGDGWA